MESPNRDAPTVQRARLGALWEDQEVEASFAPKNKKLIFLSADLFCLKSYSVKSIMSCCYLRVQAYAGGNGEVFNT